MRPTCMCEAANVKRRHQRGDGLLNAEKKFSNTKNGGAADEREDPLASLEPVEEQGGCLLSAVFFDCE